MTVAIRLIARDARFGHSDRLPFMQEVTADGDERISGVDCAAHDGVLAVESDELDGSIRDRGGLPVEQPDTGTLPLVVDRPERD